MIYDNFDDFGNSNLLKKIGNGTFGDVFIYENKYIFKTYKAGNSLGLIYDTIREIYAYNYLCKIKIPPCPKLYGIIMNKNDAGIIIDKYTYNLYNLNKSLISKYYFQIAEKLIFHVCTLALYGFSHRDIKPPNIIFDIINNKPDVKLIDFGSTRYKRFYLDDLLLSNDICTILTRAPEIFENKFKNKCSLYDPVALDIWSTGCTLYYILSPKKYLFNEEEEVAQYNKISALLNKEGAKYSDYVMREEYSFDNNLLNTLFDLLDKMVVFNPKNRISINDIINHPFMANSKKILLKNIRQPYENMEIKLTMAHISDLRRTNLEWLIKLVKKYDNKFHLAILLTIIMIDTFYNLDIGGINKTIYLASYLLASELIHPISADINFFSKKSLISVHELVKAEIRIITIIPNLYDLISDCNIIESLDEINDIEILKIGIILLLYYPDTYYDSNINTKEFILNIYKGTVKLSSYEPLFPCDINIVN